VEQDLWAGDSLMQAWRSESAVCCGEFVVSWEGEAYDGRSKRSQLQFPVQA